ncbi:hypothetical protein KDA_53270 [Dictyobacter alpinus]|uniref:Uncharacterized protein n=1 Tax=Dictyobacter alpinus TaxID=2014873 RepID=A0A402BEN4_9CHLR|nr:hypothetical protein KDA_53270 [Dictyobacter alpinus]
MPFLVVAIVAMTVALIFYTIGVYPGLKTRGLLGRQVNVLVDILSPGTYFSSGVDCFLMRREQS